MGDKIMNRLFILALLVFFFGAISIAEAGKFRVVQNGRVRVVHTRPGPVAVHRVLPPYGIRKHVYARPVPYAPVYVQPVVVPVVPVQPVYIQPVYAPITPIIVYPY